MSYHRPIREAATAARSDAIERTGFAPRPGNLSPRARIAIICGVSAGLWIGIAFAAGALLG